MINKSNHYQKSHLLLLTWLIRTADRMNLSSTLIRRTIYFDDWRDPHAARPGQVPTSHSVSRPKNPEPLPYGETGPKRKCPLEEYPLLLYCTGPEVFEDGVTRSLSDGTSIFILPLVVNCLDGKHISTTFQPLSLILISHVNNSKHCLGSHH